MTDTTKRNATLSRPLRHFSLEYDGGPDPRDYRRARSGGRCGDDLHRWFRHAAGDDRISRLGAFDRRYLVAGSVLFAVS